MSDKHPEAAGGCWALREAGVVPAGTCASCLCGLTHPSLSQSQQLPDPTSLQQEGGQRGRVGVGWVRFLHRRLFLIPGSCSMVSAAHRSAWSPAGCSSPRPGGQTQGQLGRRAPPPSPQRDPPRATASSPSFFPDLLGSRLSGSLPALPHRDVLGARPCSHPPLTHFLRSCPTFSQLRGYRDEQLRVPWGSAADGRLGHGRRGRGG